MSDLFHRFFHLTDVLLCKYSANAYDPVFNRNIGLYVMRLASFLILLLSLTSCNIYHTSSKPIPQISIHSEEVTSVIQRFAVEAKYDHHLRLEHAETCYTDDGITTIQVQFTSQDLLEMCDARALIVDLTENILAKLNQNSTLGQEFADFPFRPSNLEIYIIFDSYFGRYINPLYITWICMEDGQIAYYTFELLYSNNVCWHARRESYATSREIVVYQREAEREYAETHRSLSSIFGIQRFMPEGDL